MDIDVGVGVGLGVTVTTGDEVDVGTIFGGASDGVLVINRCHRTRPTNPAKLVLKKISISV